MILMVHVANTREWKERAPQKNKERKKELRNTNGKEPSIFCKDAPRRQQLGEEEKKTLLIIDIDVVS